MALPNSVRFGALYAALIGCSSQSIEAVGSVACLQAPQSPACAGTGGLGGTPATGGSAALGGSTTTGGAFASGGSAANAGAPGAGEGSLIHRYSFDGTGTVAVDSVGNADGSVVNTTVDGMGAVYVADDRVESNQAEDQFVDLPNGLLSSLRNSTLEAWLTWAGGASWQRIFDFGDDLGGVEDNRSTFYGNSYLFLTPQSSGDQGGLLRVAFRTDRIAEVRLDATRALPRNGKTHVAVVVDSDAEQMLLYIDGEFENSIYFPANRLSVIHDVNNWLGRSNFYYDPGFTGAFHEFRVYSAALNAAQVRASFAAGSDTLVSGL